MAAEHLQPLAAQLTRLSVQDEVAAIATVGASVVSALV